MIFEGKWRIVLGATRQRLLHSLLLAAAAFRMLACLLKEWNARLSTELSWPNLGESGRLGRFAFFYFFEFWLEFKSSSWSGDNARIGIEHPAFIRKI